MQSCLKSGANAAMTAENSQAISPAPMRRNGGNFPDSCIDINAFVRSAITNARKASQRSTLLAMRPGKHARGSTGTGSHPLPRPGWKGSHLHPTAS
jgi:hypothetical protein